MTPEELQVLIAEDKRKRETEFMRRMKELCEELRVSAFATITSHGTTATATITVKAD